MESSDKILNLPPNSLKNAGIQRQLTESTSTAKISLSAEFTDKK